MRLVEGVEGTRTCPERSPSHRKREGPPQGRSAPQILTVADLVMDSRNSHVRHEAARSRGPRVATSDAVTIRFDQPLLEDLDPAASPATERLPVPHVRKRIASPAGSAPIGGPAARRSPLKPPYMPGTPTHIVAVGCSSSGPSCGGRKRRPSRRVRTSTSARRKTSRSAAVSTSSVVAISGRSCSASPVCPSRRAIASAVSPSSAVRKVRQAPRATRSSTTSWCAP